MNGVECKCGAELVWQGSLIDGKLGCPICPSILVVETVPRGGLQWDEYPKLDPHTQMLLDEQIIKEVKGGYEACCCRCDNWTELPVGPEEIDVDYQHYCGGSPRCCP